MLVFRLHIDVLRCPPYTKENCLLSLLHAHIMLIRNTRHIFVCFHHAEDQEYYREFSNILHENPDLKIRNRSLTLPVLCANDDDALEDIRKHHITPSACTVVLCGSETYRRSHVNAEIKMTLDHEKHLLAIFLPSIRSDGGVTHQLIPPLLRKNIQTGYANTITWSEVHTPENIRRAIDDATGRSPRRIYKP